MNKIIRTNIETILVGFPVCFVMRTEKGQSLPAGLCTSRDDHLVWEEVESLPVDDGQDFDEFNLGHWRGRAAVLNETQKREGLHTSLQVGRTALISNAGTQHDANKWGLFDGGGRHHLIVPVVVNGFLYIRISPTNL